ncbi:zinc finger protein 395 isoform X2 [Cricetulus griseus]|uniref:Zinc finger protein 395 isoform X2 n=2 Tax=Cricetulus griseus TaxID=10029 RepID=A0A9J7F3A1_CRIGR|nr:zinc finger protein 395 isoform X2 [Cricetulus griseus]
MAWRKRHLLQPSQCDPGPREGERRELTSQSCPPLQTQAMVRMDDPPVMHIRRQSRVSSMLSRRLGKRSLLGARVLGPNASEVPLGASLPLEPQIEVPEGATPQPSHTSKDPVCQEQPKEVLKALGTSGHPQVAFHPGQKVCVWYGGQECKGLVEQHSWAEDKVTVRLLDQKLQICCKVEEVWLAELQGATSQVPAYRPVSRNIDVPKRKSDAVEMDEMMAAMVLTSLSCSPVVQSPPGAEPIFSVSRAACGDPWKESGDVSDSGSSTTSGHWSGSSGISTPSPPHPQASPKYLGDAFGSPQTDHGFETDSDPFLLDEPAPRKRKNSVKVMYKCLWPSCGKVLRSIVGIKRHVKALHLGDTVDPDQFKREEDFYYTEMQMKEESALAVAAPSAPGTPNSEPAPTSRVTSPSLAALSLPPPKVQSSGPEHPGLESPLPSVALSKSAPGSFWHIQADHAYQALPSFQIPVSPHIYTSISWAAAPTTTSPLSPVRSRSLSFSEPQQPPPTVKSHLIVTSPPRAQSSSRKARGEAKKCRKVYGIEHRDQWCTACRWKKACQRFLD